MRLAGRFNGPPGSANGGIACGRMAAYVGAPAVEVTLRRPPPLDTDLRVDASGGTARLHDGEHLVAEAVPSTVELEVPDPVTPEAARAAEQEYAGLVAHPFPTCFSCGTGREPGDGLRIFPGQVGDQDGAARVAATWTPHPSVSEDWHEYVDATRHASLPVTWAALDCVGAWAGDFGERLLVLGTMTARIHRLPEVGAEHVVVGLDRGQEGRKTFTASALYTTTGELVGQAEHVWIAVDPAAFN